MFVILALLGAIGVFMRVCDIGLNTLCRFWGRVSIILFLVSSSATAIVFLQGSIYEEKVNTVEIFSVCCDSNIQGENKYPYIALNGSDEYLYYYRVEDNRYTQGEVPYIHTEIIFEENLKKSFIVTYTVYKKSNIDSTWTKFLVLKDLDDIKWADKYEIHVPVGTVVYKLITDTEDVDRQK